MSRIVFALATSLIIGGTAVANAENSHVTLDCADASMCAALKDALGQAAPLPRPLTLRLVIEQQTDSGLSAHLEWDGARKGRGETMSLSVMDTTLRPSMIARFIDDLVRHSDLPR